MAHEMPREQYFLTAIDIAEIERGGFAELIAKDGQIISIGMCTCNDCLGWKE